MSDPFVAVCVPCFDYVHKHFAHHLAGFTAYTRLPVVLFMMSSSSGAARARNMLLRDVLEAEKNMGVRFTHFFWIDSDMTFPPETLEGLMFRDKDIVGASYLRRSPPYELLGKSLSGKKEDIGDTGIAQVKGLPGGMILVKREVYEAIGGPRYYHERELPNGETVGEDYTFCYDAIDKGFEVWLDLDLTKAVGHITQEVLVAGIEPKASKLILPEKPKFEIPQPEGARFV